MKYYYDLHIHSVLSPCADGLMTPNNILNMAALKGLDIVAITDHNSLKQLPVFAEIAESYAFLFVYGVEVCVKEEVHVLCYFKTLSAAMQFDRELDRHIDHTITEKVGTAYLTDNEDFCRSSLPYSLSRPLDLSLLELCTMLEPYDHLRFFAHLERPKFGGLPYVDRISMNGIEIAMLDGDRFIQENHLENKKIIHNSDAHQLMDILERTERNSIELEKLDLDSLFQAFRS
jgi:hypothetical protein